MKGKRYSVSNIFTALLLAFSVAMILKPEVKGWAIQNLMKVGLFQPDIDTQNLPEIQPGSEPVTFRDEAGNTVNLLDLRGKVVFINFWATWCPPCIAEMPSIDALYKKFKDNPEVVFLLVDVDSEFARSKQFLAKRGIAMEVYGRAGKLPEAYMAGPIPTTIVLNKQGQFAYRHEGAADYGSPEMVEMIEKLVGQGVQGSN